MHGLRLARVVSRGNFICRVLVLLSLLFTVLDTFSIAKSHARSDDVATETLINSYGESVEEHDREMDRSVSLKFTVWKSKNNRFLHSWHSSKYGKKHKSKKSKKSKWHGYSHSHSSSSRSSREKSDESTESDESEEESSDPPDDSSDPPESAVSSDPRYNGESSDPRESRVSSDPHEPGYTGESLVTSDTKKSHDDSSKSRSDEHKYDTTRSTKSKDDNSKSESDVSLFTSLTTKSRDDNSLSSSDIFESTNSYESRDKKPISARPTSSHPPSLNPTFSPRPTFTRRPTRRPFPGTGTIFPTFPVGRPTTAAPSEECEPKDCPRPPRDWEDSPTEQL